MAMSVSETIQEQAQITMLDGSPYDETTIFVSPTLALDYILGGKGKATIRSKRTQRRFTYKFSRPKRSWQFNDEEFWPTFVKVRSGPEDNRWTYIGFIGHDISMVAGKAGHADAPSFKALDYTLDKLAQSLFGGTEIWHEGICARCGRTLTVPESIMRGMGPICVKQ